MALPDAATKLRMVLDYLPCEACLAQPVEDQDLLCTICARLDRQVAVRVGTRTTILVERPSPPDAPVVIPPAETIPQPEGAPPVAVPAREILVRMADEPSQERPGTIEVVLEPLAPPAPPPAEPAPVPLVAEPEAAPEPEFDVSDIVDFVPAREQFFDFTGTARAAPPPPVREPEPGPEAERVIAPAAEPAPPQDDFVFRAPPPEEPVYAPPPPQDEVIPVEEVPLESAPEAQAQWAPPVEEPVEEPVAEPVTEAEPAPVEALVEDEILEMEVVEEDDEVVEMEVIEDEPEPAPTGKGELYRLRGFDATAEGALAKAGITEISHLSGHDAGELAHRTQLPPARVQPWVQVADLVHEVGVPVDAAIALVAAGVAGPRGLREGDADEIADRVSAFGGYSVKAADVKRWKRRA